jgi:hypothetical protein
MAEARLQAGDITGAHREADEALSSTVSAADPNMRALAWEMKSRVARAENDFNSARECVDRALAVLYRFDIPVPAWCPQQCRNLYVDSGIVKGLADISACERADYGIADSFEHDEPLRESLLTARLFGVFWSVPRQAVHSSRY